MTDMLDCIQLSQKTRDEINKWLKKFPADKKRSAVIIALHLAQDQCGGWLPPAAMNAVAEYLELPKIQVYEVATFYSMYHLKPVGKHVIDVCTNISCMLNGSQEIVDHFKNRLNIGFGETTADGKFTLREVECLAACKNAPVCQAGKKYYENLTPEKIDQLLKELE